jgi:hypothetical protein
VESIREGIQVEINNMESPIDLPDCLLHTFNREMSNGGVNNEQMDNNNGRGTVLK